MKASEKKGSRKKANRTVLWFEEEKKNFRSGLIGSSVGRGPSEKKMNGGTVENSSLRGKGETKEGGDARKVSHTGKSS